MLSLVLGLGNIGEKYKNTRHNLGFKVIEQIMKARDLRLWTGPAEYDWADAKFGSSRVIFALPKTYMNLSGLAALALLQRFNLDAGHILVVVDDINLPLGRIRIRAGGSDGGHNGLASVIEHLGTEEFPRLRMGIGPLPEKADQVEYVLKEFELNERTTVDKMIATASEAVLFCLEHDLEEAMSRYNQNPA